MTASATSLPVLAPFDAADIETDVAEPPPHWSEVLGEAPRVCRDPWLRELLAPHDEHTFVTEFLGRKPLYAPSLPGRRAHRHILTLEGLLDGIAAHRIPIDAISFLSGEGVGPPDRFQAENFLVPERRRPAFDFTRIRDYLARRRGSLVAFGLEHSFPSVWRFMAGVGEVTGSLVGANAYYTPPGARVFSPHWDTHDVLIVQLHGSKHWRVYETLLAHPLQGRLHMESNLYRGFADDLAFEERILHEGDLLYLPAGTPHAAWCEDDESLHLTGAVLPPRWHDVLADMTRLALLECEKELELRRPCPAWFLGTVDPRVVAARAGAMERFVELFREVALPRVLDRYFATQLPSPAGRAIVPADLELDTPLVRPPIVAFVHGGEGQVELVFLDRRLQFAAATEPALRWLLERRTLRASELPGLDDEARIALAGRLVDEGFLHLGNGAGSEVDAVPSPQGKTR
jgi:lysine-specific demethylase/histidyl-hydroxylase NO66